ncbi:hypothetical protein Vretifemale_10149, partial [Volvox reticuliferus]
PPPPPSPPPPPAPCNVCVNVSLSLAADHSNAVQHRFTPEQCTAHASEIAADIVREAANVNASISHPFTLKACEDNYFDLCGTFEDAAQCTQINNEGEMVTSWLDRIIRPNGEGDGCTKELAGHEVHVDAAGSLPGCFEASASITCTSPKVPPPNFPSCNCTTKLGTTPFEVMPNNTATRPGRRNTTTFFCFGFRKTIAAPDALCANAEVLQKVEIHADENLRRNLIGFSIKPSDGVKYAFIKPSWGALGTNITKVTPLGWTREQLDGGEVCMELDNSIPLGQFCIDSTGSNSCFISLFDPFLKCCPVYDVAFP